MDDLNVFKQRFNAFKRYWVGDFTPNADAYSDSYLLDENNILGCRTEIHTEDKYIWGQLVELIAPR